VENEGFYGPPTETNFCGGLLVGSQSACKAACDAFAERVCEVAADPLFAAANGVIGAAAPHTGTEKPEHMTNLFGNELVRKNHPRIRLRGRLDSLEAEMLEVQLLAAESGNTRLAEDIGELYGFVQAVLGCEGTGRRVAPVSLLGLDCDGLRRKSHNIIRNGELRFNVPDIGKGKLAVALNALRAKVREVEIDAVDAFCSGGECDRIDIIEGLNRLSSAVYILYCREAG
jgi:ethanolamine utilization cobalamin adenosyltransferase